ncbi:MAG: UvrB/UvrC motif-containing protein [Clostridia bacterium]|nr:UvrB/UvrC motif-containing protein [Clostridia bacterium]
MLCERCNKKKATVFYRENIGGRIKALRLCGECAEILEQAGELEDISAAVAGFVSPFFLSDEGIFSLPFHHFAESAAKTGTSPRLKCPSCGATIEDIGRTGKVGCASCYGVFAEELAGAIRSAHGRAEHTGRVSAGYRARVEKTERLARLKKQLKEAVSNEQYESAAGLRDEIRALEAEL